MSCLFCLNYNGIGKHCQKNVYVENTYESFDCSDYVYNQGLNVVEE